MIKLPTKAHRRLLLELLGERTEVLFSWWDELGRGRGVVLRSAKVVVVWTVFLPVVWLTIIIVSPVALFFMVSAAWAFGTITVHPDEQFNPIDVVARCLQRRRAYKLACDGSTDFTGWISVASFFFSAEDVAGVFQPIVWSTRSRQAVAIKQGTRLRVWLIGFEGSFEMLISLFWQGMHRVGEALVDDWR